MTEDLSEVTEYQRRSTMSPSSIVEYTVPVEVVQESSLDHRDLAEEVMIAHGFHPAGYGPPYSITQQEDGSLVFYSSGNCD